MSANAQPNPLGAHLDIPPERRTSNLAHAAMLSETAAEVARTLPLNADVDDFRRDLIMEACARSQALNSASAAPAAADVAGTASARGLAAAIAQKKITSAEAVARAARALEAAHSRTHCLIALDPSAAELATTADRATSTAPRGPLHGVPLAHKDMFDRTGRVPTWGARIRQQTPPTRDAAVLDRLARAGSIYTASLHLTEFAFGPTGHNYILGHARNPWNPAHITGGSSSGTAAAVAMGAIPAGLGSDTAGSLRLPAAACGVVSIKPTWGRVSRRGAMPLALVFDCLGAIARHVDDLAVMLGVVAGQDPEDGHTAAVRVPDYVANLNSDLSKVRIGVPQEQLAEAHSQVQKSVEAALEVLVKAGMHKSEAAFPNWTAIDRLAQLAQFPDAASAHYIYMQTEVDKYGPQVRSRLEAGHFISAVDHMTALRARGAVLRSVLHTTFKNADVVLLPVFADPLPTIAELDVAASPTLQATMARVVKYCRPINYLGLPSITLPAPRATSDLPCGFQLVGKPFSEPLLLAIGAAYQRVVPPMVAQA